MDVEAKNLNEKEFIAVMAHIVAALKEKGYDPYEQLTGYVKLNNPSYITKHNGARQLIVSLDISCVKNYVENMNK